jgi:MOSC domain-containing protein YiiM
MHIVSINIGKSRSIRIGEKKVATGIYKHPTAEAVRITRYGLRGDSIMDKDNHGGADQAVYLYSAADYRWWSEQLDQEILAGTFGENLTLSTFGRQPLKIGDRFQINQALLEITFPRIPCSKLGARMNDPEFVKRFVEASRPGVYTRVLHPGVVQVNDPVTFIPASDDYPTVDEVFALYYARDRDPDLIRRGLAAPIGERDKEAFRAWLDDVI